MLFWALTIHRVSTSGSFGLLNIKNNGVWKCMKWKQNEKDSQCIHPLFSNRRRDFALMVSTLVEKIVILLQNSYIKFCKILKEIVLFETHFYKIFVKFPNSSWKWHKRCTLIYKTLQKLQIPVVSIELSNYKINNILAAKLSVTVNTAPRAKKINFHS